MNERERAEARAWLEKHYGKWPIVVGEIGFRLKTVPGTIFVCGLIVGHIAWLEARNRIAALAKRARSIVNGS